jgi:hypothetical protein
LSPQRGVATKVTDAVERIPTIENGCGGPCGRPPLSPQRAVRTIENDTIFFLEASRLFDYHSHHQKTIFNKIHLMHLLEHFHESCSVRLRPRQGDCVTATKRAHLIRPAATFFYLNFHLPLSGSSGLGRWDCPAACRRQDSGADEFVTFWHWSLTQCAGSQNRSGLCPKLEPLIERPAKASSHLQE